MSHYGEPLTGKVAVILEFHIGDGQHDKGTYHQQPRNRMQSNSSTYIGIVSLLLDVDNLVKLALDAFQNVAYVNDRQVVELHAYKFLHAQEPKTVFTMRPL
jgi:Holliday junction resolvase RusA-like endonuclease